MKKFDKKQVIWIACGILIGLLIIVCFIIAAREKNISDIDIHDVSANDISLEYRDTTYGSSIELDDADISVGGNYHVSGSFECIHVDTTKAVQLVLDGADISCSNGPAIYVEDADSVRIVLKGENSVKATTTADLDGAVYSKDDLIFSGDGSLVVESNYDGIVSKDTLVFDSGTYEIHSGDDGIRGKDNVAIVDGKYTIYSSGDGIKSTNEEDTNLGNIVIDDGEFIIQSKNDAIQAITYLNINGGSYDITTADGYQSTLANSVSAKGFKSDGQVVIKGGKATFNTADDSVHSNGSIAIIGGTIQISTGDDGVHADEALQISDGSIEISHCNEGLEAHLIQIQGGNIDIVAEDDGLNGTSSTNVRGIGGRSDGKIIISGGVVKAVSGGDGIDCNGTIEMIGGTVYTESSNRAAETALDHDSTFTMTGGTLIAVAVSSGANDIGAKTSSVPMLIAGVSQSSGTIRLGTITYEPTIQNYTYIIIASSELSAGDYTLSYGSNSTSVTLKNGTTTVGNTNSGMGGNPGGRQHSTRESEQPTPDDDNRTNPNEGQDVPEAPSGEANTPQTPRDGHEPPSRH